MRAAHFLLSGAVGEGGKWLNGAEVVTGFKEDTLERVGTRFTENVA